MQEDRLTGQGDAQEVRGSFLGEMTDTRVNVHSGWTSPENKHGHVRSLRLGHSLWLKEAEAHPGKPTSFRKELAVFSEKRQEAIDSWVLKQEVTR